MDWWAKVQRWWARKQQIASCQHEWRILIENYPTFIKDYWTCKKCGIAEVFPNDAPPVPIKTMICDLGGVHIVNGLIPKHRKRKPAPSINK